MPNKALLAVLACGLSVPGCFTKSSTTETEKPDDSAGQADPAADRGRSSVTSKGAEGHKVAVRLKSAKPVRLKVKPDAGEDEPDKKDLPARAQRKPLELTGFAPTAAAPGSRVEIFGAGFAKSGNTVTVGGVAWTVEQVFADRIVAVVPDGAKDGKPSVKAGKKTVSSDREFVALADDGGFGRPGPVYNGLIGEVFTSSSELASMPDFSSLGEPTALLSAGPLDVPEASFEQGLPGADGRVTTNFAIRYTGSINVVEEAEYELCLGSDDGSLLYLEDTMVLDNDGAHASREACALVYLESGEYRLRVEYFQGTSPTVALSLRWAKDGGEKTPIPADVLFRPENPAALLP